MPAIKLPSTWSSRARRRLDAAKCYVRVYPEDRRVHSEIRKKQKQKKLGSPRQRVQVFAQFGTILEPKVRTVVVHVNGIGAIAAGWRQYDDRDFRQ